MSKSSPSIGRILTAAALICVSALFIPVGWAIARAGGAWGLGLLIVGVLPLLIAPIYVWRGGRLGAEISGDRIVIRHYFRDEEFSLMRQFRVTRGVDAIIVEASTSRIVIHDCIFPDPIVRDEFFKTLAMRSARDQQES